MMTVIRKPLLIAGAIAALAFPASAMANPEGPPGGDTNVGLCHTDCPTGNTSGDLTSASSSSSSSASSNNTNTNTASASNETLVNVANTLTNTNTNNGTPAAGVVAPTAVLGAAAAPIIIDDRRRATFVRGRSLPFTGLGLTGITVAGFATLLAGLGMTMVPGRLSMKR